MNEAKDLEPMVLRQWRQERSQMEGAPYPGEMRQITPSEQEQILEYVAYLKGQLIVSGEK